MKQRPWWRKILRGSSTLRVTIGISPKHLGILSGFHCFHLLSRNCLWLASITKWRVYCADNILHAKELEENNNRIFIDAYGVEGEVTAEVEESELTLSR